MDYTNYYINQVTNGSNKICDQLDNAIKRLNNTKTPFENLYNAFNDSEGEDIDKIRRDLNNIISYLNSLITKLQTKKNEIIKNAESCDRCYKKYKNKDYSAKENKGNYTYTYDPAIISINDNGQIVIKRTWTREKNKNIIETLVSFFVSSTGGDGIDETIISVDEMLGS